MSEQRVACEADKQVLILDTACEDIVSTIPIGQRRFLACNSKCHVLTSAPYSLQLRDGEILLWENKRLGHFISKAIFSLSEQFVVISVENKMKRGTYVLDAASGIEVNRIVKKAWNFCRFISEEECVISFQASSEGLCLYNVKSGYRLSVIDLESPVTCLAACPGKQLVAINKSDSKHGFKLIQAHLRRRLSNRNSKRFLNIGSNKKRQVREQKLSSSQTMFSGLSHQRTESNKSYTSPEKTNSKESLWTVLSQRSKKPLKNTPRASKPEPRKSMRTLVGQESFSPQSVLPKVKSPVDRRKPPSFLSSSQTRFTGLPPQRKESNNSSTSPETTNSKESLSTSTVLDQRSKRPLKNTPRASKPEPQKSGRPLVGQQCLRSLHHENAFSKVESHGGRRKPSYLSSSQATFTSPSPQRNNSYTSCEKTNSKASLSTSTVLNQGSKIPLKVTPTTSKPKPQKSTRLPVGQQSLRSFHHENVLSKVENHEDRQKSS